MLTQPNQYILILGGDYPLRERTLCGALRASNGMPIVTMTKSRISHTIKFFDDCIVGDVFDPKAALDAVQQYEKTHQQTPAAVIPILDISLNSVLAIAQHYKLNHHSANTIRQCRDKFLMKQVLAEAGLPVPRFGTFSNLEELTALIQTVGLPAVIKPREFGGSIGVIKVTEQSELKSVFEKCIQDIRSLNGEYKADETSFIVEEYIPAHQEVSVEVFNHGSLHQTIAVTDKYLGEEPYFVEVGHSVPSVHSGNAYLREVAEKACSALGITFGMAHFEARIMPSGDIRIIEVGARPGGDAIMDLVERTYGVSPYELHTASYLNTSPALPASFSPKGLSAIAFLKAPEGIITHITLPSELPPSVMSIKILTQVMSKSVPLTSWLGREGVVEYFWPNRAPEPRLTDHLSGAKELSNAIFSVEN